MKIGRENEGREIESIGEEEEEAIGDRGREGEGS